MAESRLSQNPIAYNPPATFTIAEWLREWLDRTSTSTADLARRAGVTRRELRDLLNRKRCSTRVWFAVLRAIQPNMAFYLDPLGS